MKSAKTMVAVCLLAAAVTSTAITGCSSSGTSQGQNQESRGGQGQNQESQESQEQRQESQENPAAADTSGTGSPAASQTQEENKSPGKAGTCAAGKTLEAKEPEKADISPEDYEGWNRLLKAQTLSGEFQKGLEQFAWKSGSQVLKDAPGNGNFSPLSLYYTLALAGCGAEGETAAQILGSLGVEDQKELADQCRRLYQWYVYQTQRDQEQMAHYGMEGNKSTIRLGNSLWISNQLPVYEDYQNLAAEQFFASSYGVDFGDPSTGKQMGDWIAEKTKGVLAPQLEPDPATALAILNTLYFYGGWAEPFVEGDTREDVFTLEDGTRVQVPYMNQTRLDGAFKKRDGCTLSWLDTGNDCRMIFLLPDPGKTVEEFLESPEKLEVAMEAGQEGWSQGTVVWKVPKFSFGSSYRLEDTLAAMGMDRMFGEQAELGGISPEHLYVSSVIQETHIGVDEQGVEGAAYTMLAMECGAVLEQEETAEMILDRPFLFGIRDNAHDVWLFLGVCRNPES